MRTVRYRPPLKPPPGAAHINWGHPLAQGLGFAFFANEGAGHCYDSVANIAPQTRGSPVMPTWIVSPGGVGHQATKRWYARRAEIYNATAYSALVLLDDRIDTGMPSTDILGVLDGLDVNQQNWKLAIDDSSLVLDSFVVRFNTGRSQFPFNIRLAGVHAWGFRIDPVAVQTSAYRDGVFVANATEIDTYLTSGSSNAYPFLGAPSVSTGITILASYVWLRALTTAEMVSITADPYAFLAPLGPRVRWNTAAASTDVFFENVYPIESGMKPQTAAGMGGVLVA